MTNMTIDKTRAEVKTFFPFLPVLGLLFIALKLTGFITWSWWLVLLPIYGPAVFVILVAILITVQVVIEQRKKAA